MKRITLTFALLALGLFGTLAASAQNKPRPSPADTVITEINGSKISIAYSRPYTKDPKSGEVRKIWGGLVPYGQVWRTGANEATVLKTEKDLSFGSTKVPAGSYSLWTVPEADGSAKLIVNKETGQWGTKHDASKDFVTIPLQKKDLSQTVDQFTISVEGKGGSEGTLKMAWEKTEYSATFSVAK